MSKRIFALFFLLLVISTRPVLAEKVEENVVPEQVEARQLDKQAKILAQYLSKQNSPLEYHAQDFIDAAKTYNLDWRLLPAIAGVESTFGRFIPGGYNAWGWGVYGNQAIYFNSWKEAIFAVSKGLRENYLDKGLTNPYAMNRIYAASSAWSGKVTYFMQDIEKLASQYKDEEIISLPKTTPNIAAVSASLVLR